MKSAMMNAQSDEIIFLNVGGVYFVTRRTTLLQSDSFFAGAVRSNPDIQELFVDRDPTHFRHVLNWIRGVKFLPDDDMTLQELAWEADYYCLAQLKEAIVRVKYRFSSVPRSLSGIHHELKQIGKPTFP
jgi:hypothetical protein